jgi:DNA topoisomerase VI subunit A
MLLRLRTEILPTVQPYRMSVSELQTYQAYTQPFSKDYAEKLKKLKEQERLSDCLDCINYMLNNKVRLEQEAMLT